MVFSITKPRGWGQAGMGLVLFRTEARILQCHCCSEICIIVKEWRSTGMLKKLLIGSSFGLLLAAGTIFAEVVVTVRPPAAIVETRPASPGPNYVWIAGYHRWDGHAYAWA